MRKILFVLPVVALFAGCKTLETKFRHADTNQDGKLSRAEFSDGIARLAFSRYDADKDGSVTLAEWRAVEGTGSDKQFAMRDLNHDGKITVAEAQTVARRNGGFSKLFTAVDANNDGDITLPEAKAYAKAHPKKR